MLLYDADHIARSVEDFLLKLPGVKRAQATGDYRRTLFRLACGVKLKVERAQRNDWGRALIASTGSVNHLRKLPADFAEANGDHSSEEAVYRSLGLNFIEPELREAAMK